LSASDAYDSTSQGSDLSDFRVVNVVWTAELGGLSARDREQQRNSRGQSIYLDGNHFHGQPLR
jgi:hypothetical protein